MDIDGKLRPLYGRLRAPQVHKCIDGGKTYKYSERQINTARVINMRRIGNGSHTALEIIRIHREIPVHVLLETHGINEIHRTAGFFSDEITIIVQ